jgi:hypothetical protein
VQEPVVGVLPGFDVLEVTGAASFAGTLNVQRVGLINLNDRTWEFLTYESKTGSFTTINFSGFTGQTPQVVLATTSATVTTGEVMGGQATVQGRHIFYNESAFDTTTDDGAIATNKTALLPGQTATYANYINYSRGINGIMVDIAELASNPTVGTIGNYFEFTLGNDNTPADWTPAAAPIGVTVRAGEGTNGSDRVTIIWANNAIPNERWLEVTVLANASTGLATPDVHYWGLQIAETGNSAANAIVDLTDTSLIRSNPTPFLQNAGITNAFDVNRSNIVDLLDTAFARSNPSSFLNELKLITPQAAPPETAGSGEVAGGEAPDSFVEPTELIVAASSVPAQGPLPGTVASNTGSPATSPVPLPVEEDAPSTPSSSSSSEGSQESEVDDYFGNLEDSLIDESLVSDLADDQHSR